jgi:hypothetical protein
MQSKQRRCLFYGPKTASEAEHVRVTSARVRRLYAELINGVEQYDITSEQVRLALRSSPLQAKAACVDIIEKTFRQMCLPGPVLNRREHGV